MKFVTIPQLFIVYLFINYRADSQLNSQPFSVDSFYWRSQQLPLYHFNRMGGWGMGSHEVTGKGRVNIEKQQMASKDAISPHTSRKAAKSGPWPNSLISKSCMWLITAGCLLVRSHLKTTRALVDSDKPAQKCKPAWSTLSTMQYSYLKSVSCCCVRERLIFTNPVTNRLHSSR